MKKNDQKRQNHFPGMDRNKEKILGRDDISRDGDRGDRDHEVAGAKNIRQNGNAQQFIQESFNKQRYIPQNDVVGDPQYSSRNPVREKQNWNV